MNGYYAPGFSTATDETWGTRLHQQPSGGTRFLTKRSSSVLNIT